MAPPVASKLLVLALAMGGATAAQLPAQAEPATGTASLVWQLDPPPPLPPVVDLSSAVALAPKVLVWELEPAATPAVAPQASGAPLATTALVWEVETGAQAELPGLSGSPVASQPPTGPPVLVGVPLLEPYPAPNIGGGQPSAYNASWGDYYIGASAATPGKQRDGVVDGSVNMGIGFGDPLSLLGIEVGWNIASTKNFNANGTLDITASRFLVNASRLQVVLGGGVQSIYSYGPEGKPPVNGYGVVTLATPLRAPNPFFNQVLQISAGIGGNTYASLDANFEGPETGYFAALGLEVTSNVGLSLGLSGRGTNVNLSYTPLRDLPFTINVLAADVFNNSPFGTVGVLSVSWGDNFRTALF